MSTSIIEVPLFSFISFIRTYKEVEMGVREEEAERRFCFLNDRAGCGGVEYAAGLLLEV